MELQCGEFEARSKKIKIKNLTVKQYLHFVQTHKQSDLTVDHLNKIISIHGFKMLHKVKKEVMIDAVGSIELMDLTRSTLEDDNISSVAFVTSEEAIKDLMCLNWMECSITSFKTLNSANYDLMNLQNAKTVALKSKTMKRKPPKLRRINDGMEPTRSLACGDQCAANGSASDCAVVDHLSSTSLLLEAGEE